MSVMKRIATNYIIQMLGKGLGMVAGLAVIALLGRYLGDEDWAAYITATTFLSFFGVFVDFGLTLTLTQMISVPGADEKKITGSILGIRLTSGAIFYTLSILVVTLLPYSNEAKAAVAAGAAAFFFMSAAGSLIGVFQKHLAIRRYVVAELISRGFYLVFTLLCVVFNLGLLWILGAMGLANGLWLIFVIVAAKPLIIIRPQFDWKTWKEAFHRSAPIAVSTLFNLMYLRGDVLILSWVKPNEVGQYGAAYKVIDVATALPTMFMGLVLPQLTQAWGENKENFKNILQKSLDIFLLAVIPMLFGVQIVAESLTMLIIGPKFAVAGLVLKILVLAIVFVFISTLYGHTIVALHKQKIMTWGYAFTAAVSVIGYIIFIPRYGMWGAAWVTCLSEFLIALLTFIVVSRVTKTLPNLTVAFKAILASIIMYLVLITLPDLPVLVEVALGGLVYVVTIISIGGIKVSDLKTLLLKSKGDSF
ncbi:MAG: flippase [Candidatus Uhrbacteria bacterium]